MQRAATLALEARREDRRGNEHEEQRAPRSQPQPESNLAGDLGRAQKCMQALAEYGLAGTAIFDDAESGDVWFPTSRSRADRSTAVVYLLFPKFNAQRRHEPQYAPF